MDTQYHIDALLNACVSAADLVRSALLATDGHEHACHHGKMLTVHCHGWDSTGGQNGLMRVGIRIDGTHSDIGQIFHAPSALIAKSMSDAVKDELEKIGRFAPPTVESKRGGARLGAGAKPLHGVKMRRVPVFLDAESESAFRAYGEGNLSEGIRRAAKLIPPCDATQQQPEPAPLSPAQPAD